MAIKSESIKGVILNCPSCRRKTAINLTEEPTDARVCKNCQAKMSITEPVTIELTQPKGKGVNGIKIDVGIDVSDALKGLKAVQREAKKTAQLLKEVESRRDIKDLSDDELLDEFSFRGWIVEDATFHAGNSEEPLYRRVEIHKTNENQEE